MAKKLTDAELSAIISQQIELAKNHYQNGRATARDKALDYYFGRMDKYVPAEVNRSKVVSRDVADTIGWLMPQIMRVFTASGRMFLAEMTELDGQEIEGADDVAAVMKLAEVISDGLNYVFWKDNFGYGNVYDGTWDSLLHGDGITKTFFDDTPVYGPAKTFEGLTEDHLALLVDDERVDVLAKDSHDSLMPDEFGTPIQVKLYDVRVRVKKRNGRFVVNVIPPEEFLISEDAVNLEDAAFKAHWQRKTRSDLVEMGYSKEVVAKIPTATRTETPEEQARRAQATFTEATDTSTELVDYFECYPRIDADGDGVAEMLRVCYGGGKAGELLDWEVWEDEDPFDNIPCEPIPHRWDSRSVADEEFDVQDIKTTLSRQLMNNIYWANNPQRAVIGKVLNPEQLDTPTFGGTIMLAPGSSIVPLDTPNVADAALAGIQYMDEVSARRTGVNSQSMAIDPEVLQNQSATANQNATDASRSQPELIARNQAEYGWVKVGKKLLRLMVAHPERRVVLVKGKPLIIDPATWDPDMQVNVNTGLGTGSRDKDMVMLGRTLQNQLLLAERLMVAGDTEDAIEMLPKIVATMTKMDEAAGIRDPEDFYPEFTKERLAQLKEFAAQPKPNPNLEEIAAQGEVQKSLKVVDAETDRHAAELKAQGEVVKNQAELDADLTTKEADRQNALAIEAMKQQGAERIEMMRIASAERLKQMDLQHQAQQAEAQRNNAVQIAAMKPKPEPSGKAAN